MAPNKRTDLPSLPASFPVVGIGASAGGLEAFTELLRNLDTKTGMAFVLIQHLDPRHPSQLAEILSRTTAMPVADATDGVVVEADHVYLLPPNTAMAYDAGRLKLTPRAAPNSEGHCPIDHFLGSLARDLKENSVGVVLSGTGSDGAEGTAEIMAEGGIAMAQEPRTARFAAMPAAAIASGADFILPPAGIAKELAGIAVTLRARNTMYAEAAQGVGAEPKDFSQVLAVLQAAKGMDFSSYKRPTVQRRIFRRMAMQQIGTIAEYLSFLTSRSAEIDALYEDMLVKVTCFFRDPVSFDALKREVFPRLVATRVRPEAIRVWVPGCATEAVNEELIVLNTELQGKIDELSTVNSDLDNVLASSSIATVVLDRALQITRFSRSMAQVFNLIPTDIGRALRDITSRLTYDGVVGDAETVLQTLEAADRIVGTKDGRALRMRITPYRTHANVINGVVIAFADISEQQTLSRAIVALRHALDLRRATVAVLDRAGTVVMASEAFSALLGRDRVVIEGRTLAELGVQALPAFAAMGAWTGTLTVPGRGQPPVTTAAELTPVAEAPGLFCLLAP